MEIETIGQLLNWMNVNCYNDSYAIGDRSVYEGYGLDFNGSLYIWYYTERGKRQELKHFQTEKEAAAYAFDIIRSDQYANRHMIGFIETTTALDKLINELKDRNINYYQDVIIYSNDKPRDRFRVFVFGCDLNKVRDLERRYGFKRLV